MPVAPHYRAEPRFGALGPTFSDAVTPAAFPQPVSRWRDDRAAARVGLETLDDTEWTAAFARFQPLPGNQPEPLAVGYHGHQFRVYNPDIGDGRGFLFAQMRDDRGRLLDLGTKGSGTTPYSRSGDGRMTLLGGLREVIAAGFLEAVGTPTCAIISLFETGERLARQDEPSPTRGAVLTRLQHSHVRIGVFQRQAYFENPAAIRELVAYCIDVFYPELAAEPEDDQPAAFLEAVVEANARLAATWMAAGFVHGVLNSDNMTVTGESFDYGPFRFLPVYAPDFTAAYFDQGGIYAYGRQAEATLWNLTRLAECLTFLAPQAALEQALNTFQPRYQAALGRAFARRLGVATRGEAADLSLVRAFTRFALESRAPWEGLVFDWFGGSASHDRAMQGPRARLYRGEAFEGWRACALEREPADDVGLDHPYFARDWPFTPTIDVIHAAWARVWREDDWSDFAAVMTDIALAREAYRLAPQTPRR